MRAHLDVENTHVVARTATSARVSFSSLWEVAAISIAWPLGLGRFVSGLMTEHYLEALQGLAFFFVVFFYTLVRLYQLRRVD
jgi:hypothetical protein